jgi:transposase, IS5 family
MRPKPIKREEWYKPKLCTLVDRSHELVVLSEKIDWEKLSEVFGSIYQDIGRPGIPVRVMLSVQLLKYIHNVSDEVVVRRWVENPYWQYFSGMEYFEHRFPFDSSSMSRWRKKVNEEQLSSLLQESLSAAMKCRCLRVEDLQ